MVADINAVHAGKLGLDFFFFGSFSFSEGLDFSVGILIYLFIYLFLERVQGFLLR